jgi:hypothetical protein
MTLETVSKAEVLNDTAKAYYSSLFPDITTERGLLNLAYRMRALHHLENSWLCDKELMTAGEPDAWQPLILTELGKIRDIPTMRELAAELCKIKPKAKEGALMVRNARIGKPAGNSLDLANTIIKTINEYMSSHEISKQDIMSALYAAIDSTNESL